MTDNVLAREALDLLRANSQFVRQIREVHDRVIAIELQYGLTANSLYSDLSQEFKSVAPLNGDVIKKRALNTRLRKELVDHRAYLTALRARVRRMQSPNI
ncbi:hypothetical protein GCM10022268_32430 [Sphingomonas cynarae]|uniref:Uncharacterized protein n=1 Tax=Sphingomonas cynarae TaxID=930197 RepID=A0ABP7EQW6_9SPHN